MVDHDFKVLNLYDESFWRNVDIDELVQERCNSSVLAMELRLSCINPSIYTCIYISYYPELKGRIFIQFIHVIIKKDKTLPDIIKLTPCLLMTWYSVIQGARASSLVTCKQRVNSSPSSATYMHQWMGSALVQIMACRLFNTNPLSKPMLEYCWLEV